MLSGYSEGFFYYFIVIVRVVVNLDGTDGAKLWIMLIFWLI